SHNFTPASMIPVFTKVNPLPGAQCQLAVGDRNGERRADDHALYMGGGVVRPFEGVLVVIGVLRHHDIEVPFQITAYVRIGVFIDRQGSGGVLNEQVQQAHFTVGQLRCLSQDVLGDQV